MRGTAPTCLGHPWPVEQFRADAVAEDRRLRRAGQDARTEACIRPPSNRLVSDGDVAGNGEPGAAGAHTRVRRLLAGVGIFGSVRGHPPAACEDGKIESQACTWKGRRGRLLIIENAARHTDPWAYASGHGFVRKDDDVRREVLHARAAGLVGVHIGNCRTFSLRSSAESGREYLRGIESGHRFADVC
jgi:hypothetical protein